MKRTLTRAAVAALTVAIVAGPFAATGYSAAQSCAPVTTEGDWTTIEAPSFPSGPAQMTTFAVDPFVPILMYATNGEALVRTVDGGCSWDDLAPLDALPSLDKPAVSALTTIKQIVIPDRFQPPTERDVYLLAEERVGPAARPHFIASHDGGENWKVQNTGLPAVTGGVLSLVVAPSDPDTMYLQLLDDPTEASDVTYASTNGGEAWEQRSQPDAGVAFDLAVDPLDPDSIWSWGASLYHSTDGGRTRAEETAVGFGTSMVDVFREPGQPARIMAYTPETKEFAMSRDGGLTWTRFFGPGMFAHSITHGSSADSVVISGHKGVYRFDAPEYWIDIRPEDQPDLYELQPTHTSQQLIFARSIDNTIERYNALSEEVSIDPFVAISDQKIEETTKLQPSQRTIKLDAGESKAVDYTLGLPPHPRPLDVFFLVDTSSSMEYTINGLRAGTQQIVTALENARLDVQFGVGEYKDYPIPGFGSPEAGDFPYRLNRRIGPADEELANALEQLQASGGGKDAPESQLTGLYQAATGEGEPGFVPAGQDAGFRPGSLKVIVHMTDAQFHDEATHPSPPFQQVAEALRAKDIRHIGLAIYGEEGVKSLDDLTSMSKATDSIAPRGVDCDSDRQLDVATGQPLACRVGTDDLSSLADAIVSTLRAVTDRVEISLTTEQSPLVDTISPSTYPGFNVHDPGSLQFEVTFNCPRQLAGTSDNVALAGLVAGRPIGAIAHTKVVCRPVDEAEAVKEILPLIAVAAIVTPQRLPAPPPAPPAVSESAPGTQQMFQAQPAAAAQEQEEVQTAVAWQEAVQRQAAEETYSFTSVRRSQPPWALYGAAALLGMAYAGASLARSAVRLRTARSRRS